MCGGNMRDMTCWELRPQQAKAKWTLHFHDLQVVRLLWLFFFSITFSRHNTYNLKIREIIWDFLSLTLQLILRSTLSAVCSSSCDSKHIQFKIPTSSWLKWASLEMQNGKDLGLMSMMVLFSIDRKLIRHSFYSYYVLLYRRRHKRHLNISIEGMEIFHDPMPSTHVP
jgi:hypothetical protein